MADAAEVQDVVEDIKELADDTVELVGERVSWITQNAKAAALTAGLAGIALGLSAGVFLASKKLKARYQQMADEQIADVKAKYTVERVMPEKPPLEELAEASEARATTQRIIADNGYVGYHKVEPQVEMTATSPVVESPPEPPAPEMVPIDRNIFESRDADTYFDFEEELARREERPDMPFVITRDEYTNEGEENDKVEMVYFEGDVTITDASDQVVPPATVGEDNLDRFGAGSGDLNVVFIRNNKLGIDIELVKDSGKYVEKVLGLNDEQLQHADERPLRNRRRQ